MNIIAVVYPQADKIVHPAMRAAQEHMALTYAAALRDTGVAVLVPLASPCEITLALDKLSAMHVICMPTWREDDYVQDVLQAATLHGVPVHRHYMDKDMLCCVCWAALECTTDDLMPCAWGGCPYDEMEDGCVTQ